MASLLACLFHPGHCLLTPAWLTLWELEPSALPLFLGIPSTPGHPSLSWHPRLLPGPTWLSFSAFHSVMVSVTFLVFGFFSSSSSSSAVQRSVLGQGCQAAQPMWTRDRLGLS